MSKRRDRNRKRSKRRAIYCPVHHCYLDSVSQKYPLFANTADQLQQRGLNRKRALMAIAHHNAVLIHGEWLEAFWCDDCQETTWYHVCRTDAEQQDGRPKRTYAIRRAPKELWQQVCGVIQPAGNPTVGEFTRRQSRMVGFNGVKDFQFVQ